MFPIPRALTTSSIKVRSGAALVLVLAALALISFLLIAVTTLVQSENRGSYTAADLVQVRMLSQLPEKLVISQIRRATGTPDNLKGTGYTWTSQPGMIKVFGTTVNGSKPRAAVDALYKLYSARKVKLKGTEEQDPDNGPIGEATRLQALMEVGRRNAAETVDLNEPVRVEPSRAEASNRPRFVFPIVDPAAVGLVEGFRVHSENNTSPNAPPPDGEIPPLKATANTYNPAEESPRLAMPVTWLYVLQDGSVIPPDRGVIPGEVQFGGSGTGGVTPSAENPIVGRIAYWTDDESSKLNVNTATEPAPWEPPHTHTTADENYAASIPARNEFYRNSGHPAYTSLSPVLRRFGQTGTAFTEPEREPADSSGFEAWWKHISSWHQWLPRTFDTSTNTDQGTEGGTKPAGGEVTIKQDRLFATVDEMIFAAEATANGIGRKEYNTSDPAINPEDLSKVRFFLTTHNRAPELNLYGRPKISLWPL
ncbi:MAG: Verru Chthon cassette protein, partial [Verrucomicrobiaceae bacterium]|nr:Verru Chthon cassette protein [Verrucomicrobiaceae bacterium]